MPKVWEKRVEAIRKDNPSMPKSEAYALATTQLQKSGVLKPGTRTLAKKGGKKR